MKKSLLKICYAAMVAALTCVCTMFIKIPTPATQGYIHAGDAVILIGVYLLGWWAVPAAAIGSMMADFFGGYAHWMLPTLLIKGAMAAMFSLINGRSENIVRIVVAAVAGAVVMMGGYFAAECVMYGVGGAVASILPNFVQGAFAFIVAPCVTVGLKAVHFKKLVRIQ